MIALRRITTRVGHVAALDNSSKTCQHVRVYVKITGDNYYYLLLRHRGSTAIQKSYKTHKKIIGVHYKNYKYKLTSTGAINACFTASFVLSLVDVGLTAYLLHRNM